METMSIYCSLTPDAKGRAHTVQLAIIKFSHRGPLRSFLAVYSR